jgi:TPR repeat protein
MDNTNFWIIVFLVVLLACCLIFVLWTKNSKKPTISQQGTRDSRGSRDIKQKIQKIENEQGGIESLSDTQTFVLADTYHYGRYGKPVNVKKAIDLYLQSIDKSSNIEHIGKCYMAVARVYIEGWKDNHPDAIKAIKWFLKAIECGYEDGILEIANIYMYGLHPHYLPDKLTAGKIYSIMLYTNNFSDSARTVCTEHMKQIAKMGYSDLDAAHETGRTYYTLPSNIEERISICLESANTRHVEWTHTSSPVSTLQNVTRIVTMTQNQDETNTNILDFIPVQKIYNDSQNVHSSTVQNAAQNTIEYIENKTGTVTDFTNSVSQFIQEIENRQDMKPSEKENIKKVLDSLSESIHSRYDKSEKDVFNLVWTRINDRVNNERRSDMIKVFADNISSGVEHDNVVCSSGKIVRMIGSLDGMDAEPLPSLKPEWAINEEIASSASAIRNKVLERATTNQRKAYEALDQTDEQKQIAEHLSNIMRTELRQKCKVEYLDTNILSEDVLESKFADYIDNM